MVKRKLNKVLMTVCFCVFFCCFSCVMYALVRKGYATHIIGGVVLFALLSLLFVFLKKNEKKLSRKKINIIFAVFCAVFLILQIILVSVIDYHYKLIDPQITSLYAKRYVETGSMNITKESFRMYMAKYPNAWGMTYLYMLFYKIVYTFTGEITMKTAEYLNIIMLQLTVIMTFQTAKRIFKGNAMPLFCGLITVVMPVFLLYTPFMHSDTAASLFIILAIYFLVRMYQSKKTRNVLIFGGLAGLTIGLGNVVKGSVTIVLVAAIIMVLLKYRIKLSAVLSVIFLALYFLTTTLSYQIGMTIGISNQELIDRYKFPTAHWLMMGLADGHVNSDVDYTISFETYDERKEADLKVIKERILEMNTPKKIAVKYYKRIKTTWSDGTFHYWRPISNSRPPQWLKNILNSDGLNYYVSCWHSFIFIAMLFGFIYNMKKSRRNGVSISALTIVGMILFMLIWENLTRYIVAFIPLYMIVSTIGIRYFTAFIQKKIARVKLKSNKSELSQI